MVKKIILFDTIWKIRIGKLDGLLGEVDYKLRTITINKIIKNKHSRNDILLHELSHIFSNYYKLPYASEETLQTAMGHFIMAIIKQEVLE